MDGPALKDDLPERGFSKPETVISVVVFRLHWHEEGYNLLFFDEQMNSLRASINP